MGDPFTVIAVVVSLYSIARTIYSWFFEKGPEVFGPKLKDKEQQISTYGIPIPVIYGTIRLAGNVIWAGPWIEVAITETIGKGGGASSTTYEYKRSFAVAFCEGPVDNVLKIWCDFKLIYNITGDNEKLAKQPGTSGGFKFYSGSESQLPDPTMEGYEGVGNVPAYRGVSYIVFKNLNLSRYANRMPNIRVLVGKATKVSNFSHYPVPNYTSDDGWGEGGSACAMEMCSALIHPDGMHIITLFYSLDEYLGYTSSTFRKINTYTRQIVSEKIYPDYSIPVDGDLDPEFCIFLAPFGQWNLQFVDIDELGFLYAVSCEGYGRVAKLDSDTFTVQVWGPEFEPIGGGAGSYPRVSKNPAYPYLWLEGPGCIYLLNRDTLTSPFDGSYGYKFTYPVPQTGEDHSHLVGMALGPNSEYLWVVWAEHLTVPNPDQYIFWASKLYPSGSMEHFNITSELSEYADNDAAFVLYDEDTDQLIILDDYPTSARIFALDATSLTLNYASAIKTVSWWSASVFQQGAVGGYLYVIYNNYDSPYDIAINKIDILTGDVVETWDCSDLPDENPGHYTFLINPIFMEYKNSIFVHYRADNIDMHEIFLDRYNPDTVLLRDIVSDVCVRSSIATSSIDASMLTQTVDGYLVSDQRTALEAIRPLANVYMFNGVEVDDTLTFVRRGGPSIATITENELCAHLDSEERPSPLKQIIKQETNLPVELTIQYFDPAINQDVNVQQAKRLVANTVNRQSVQVPVVMDKDRAKQLAEIMLAWSWTSRTSFEFSIGMKYLHLVPTDVITIEKGESIYRMMLTDLSVEGSVIKCQAVQDYESLYVSMASGVIGLLPDEEIDFAGPAIWYLLDTPPLQDTQGNSGGLYSVANGYTDYFTGADIYMYDTYSSAWSVFASPSNRAVTGVAITATPRFDYNIFDEGNTVTVRLDYEDHSLESCAEAEIMSGSNYALLGDEIIQFQNVTDEGNGKYTLSKLLRGRKGTEWATKNHLAGEKFVLLSALTVSWTSLNNNYLEVETQFRGVSHDNSFADGTNKLCIPYFRTLKPWSPVHLSVVTSTSFSWIRRNRIQNGWLNYQDVPLSEVEERYEVDFYTGTTLSLTKTTYTSSCSATLEEMDMVDSIVVYQMSDVVGRGFASATLNVLPIDS